jgi:quinol monooxygenase YgiN
MHCRVARFQVRPEEVAAAKAAIARFVAAVHAEEPGTLRYDAFQEEDGVSFLHIMCFQDEAAETHHRGTAHVRAFVTALYPLCAVAPWFTAIEAVTDANGP